MPAGTECWHYLLAKCHSERAKRLRNLRSLCDWARFLASLGMTALYRTVWGVLCYAIACNTSNKATLTMAYITTTQLQSRLGSTLYARLTDRVNGTTADPTVAQQIVDEAEAVANSHLAKRYATPIDLTTHPELSGILEARVLDLAEYLGWRDSPFVADIPERIRLMHDETSDWFASIASGKIDLPASAPPASRTAVDDSARYTEPPRSFTHDELDGL